jgi:hypothetical protein
VAYGIYSLQLVDRGLDRPSVLDGRAWGSLGRDRAGCRQGRGRSTGRWYVAGREILLETRLVWVIKALKLLWRVLRLRAISLLAVHACVGIVALLAGLGMWRISLKASRHAGRVRPRRRRLERVGLWSWGVLCHGLGRRSVAGHLFLLLLTTQAEEDDGTDYGEAHGTTGCSSRDGTNIGSVTSTIVLFLVSIVLVSRTRGGRIGLARGRRATFRLEDMSGSPRRVVVQENACAVCRCAVEKGEGVVRPVVFACGGHEPGVTCASRRHRAAKGVEVIGEVATSGARRIIVQALGLDDVAFLVELAAADVGRRRRASQLVGDAGKRGCRLLSATPHISKTTIPTSSEAHARRLYVTSPLISGHDSPPSEDTKPQVLGPRVYSSMRGINMRPISALGASVGRGDHPNATCSSCI